MHYFSSAKLLTTCLNQFIIVHHTNLAAVFSTLPRTIVKQQFEQITCTAGIVYCSAFCCRSECMLIMLLLSLNGRGKSL
jgi:hypothetical protein